MKFGKPKLASSASVFAERGDPWMTEREAEKDYPLSHTLHPDASAQSVIDNMFEAKARSIRDRLKTKAGVEARDFKAPRRFLTPVDPELDAFTKTARAVPREPLAPDKPISSRPDFASERRRVLNRVAQMNRRANKKPISLKPSAYITRADPDAERRERLASKPKGFSVYVRMKDGGESETNRATMAQVDVFIRRLNERNGSNVDVIEVWSHTTGEQVK